MSTTLQRIPYFEGKTLQTYTRGKAILDFDWRRPKSSYFDKPLEYVDNSEDDLIFKIENQIFKLPKSLSHIASAIKKSATILDLKDDWDEEGALATSTETFLKAIKFIIEYSTFIFSGKGMVIIDSPSIDILRDGAIIVNWETLLGSFTIIFEKHPSEIYYYYAKEKENLIPLKYGININKEVNEYTALWMEKNLKYTLPNLSH